MYYLLKYKDFEIGKILCEKKEFPNFFGKFEKNVNLKFFEIESFIKLSIKESSLISISHENDITSELEIIEKELEKYIEFIESEEWKLFDENKKEYKILVPSFQQNNEIVFRFQF